MSYVAERESAHGHIAWSVRRPIGAAPAAGGSSNGIARGWFGEHFNEPFANVRTGLADAISEIVPDGHLELAVVLFAETAETVVAPTVIDSTAIRDAMVASVQQMIAPGGVTRLWEAFELATTLITDSSQFGIASLQYLNAITDGQGDLDLMLAGRNAAVAAGIDVVSFEGLEPLNSDERQRMRTVAYPQPSVLVNSSFSNLPTPIESAGFLMSVDKASSIEAGYLAKLEALGALDDCHATAQLGNRTLQVSACPEGGRLALELVNGQVTVQSGPVGIRQRTVGSFAIGNVDQVSVVGLSGADDIINELGSGFGDLVAIHGGAGNDTITSNTPGAQLFGDAGHDVITAAAQLESLLGGDGNDTLSGSGAGQMLFGGNGNDTLVGSHPFQALSGETGNDDISHDVGNTNAPFATISGGLGNDTISGSGSYAVLHGGEGADMVSGGGTEQRIFGGAGNDTLSASDGRVAFWGEDGNDVILAGRANSLLEGGSGDDSLVGWLGDDSLVGGDGDDTLRGREGADLLWLRDETAAHQIDLVAGSVTSDSQTDTLELLEHVLASDGDDVVRGDDSTNLLIGGGGDDTLFGSGAGDTILGGAGFDLFDAGEGDDWLLDLDELLGLNQADTLLGGPGSDIGLIGDLDVDQSDDVEVLFNSVDDLLASLG